MYVHDLFKSRNRYNIFHECYHELVKALASYAVSPNVCCVNIDAVIAVILLKMLWRSFVEQEISEQFLEYGAFTTFVNGRLVGEAAELEDHTTRGRNQAYWISVDRPWDNATLYWTEEWQALIKRCSRDCACTGNFAFQWKRLTR